MLSQQIVPKGAVETSNTLNHFQVGVEEQSEAKNRFSFSSFTSSVFITSKSKNEHKQHENSYWVNGGITAGNV